VILDSRLRDRSKKSAFAYNLERLQRRWPADIVFGLNLSCLSTSGRRQGQATTSESDEDDEEDDANDSESFGLGHPAKPAVFAGARLSRMVSDDDANQDEDVSEDNDDNDFIVEDDGAEDVPELPTMFSMGTFQVRLTDFVLFYVIRCV
jgi:hypothetical protein